MRSIIKLGAFLLIIAGLAGFGIGYVNTMTGPVIARQAEEAKIKSMQEIYQDAEEIKNVTADFPDVHDDPVLKEINVACRNSTPVGVIYTVEPNGYNGKITAMVAYDIETKKITGIKILQQSETPGLGAQASESWFAERFKDKSLTEPIEIVKHEPAKENQVQAITAATITSNAVALGENMAREHFLQHFVQ